jgi:hypothetical protein
MARYLRTFSMTAFPDVGMSFLPVSPAVSSKMSHNGFRFVSGLARLLEWFGNG